MKRQVRGALPNVMHDIATCMSPREQPREASKYCVASRVTGLRSSVA